MGRGLLDYGFFLAIGLEIEKIVLGCGKKIRQTKLKPIPSATSQSRSLLVPAGSFAGINCLFRGLAVAGLSLRGQPVFFGFSNASTSERRKMTLLRRYAGLGAGRAGNPANLHRGHAKYSRHIVAWFCRP